MLDVFDRGARRQTGPTAATATGEFQSVVLGLTLGWPASGRDLPVPFAARVIQVGEVVLGFGLVEIGLAGEEVTLDGIEGTADAAWVLAGLRCPAVAVV
jgi:hypothetical protein